MKYLTGRLKGSYDTAIRKYEDADGHSVPIDWVVLYRLFHRPASDLRKMEALSKEESLGNDPRGSRSSD